MNFTAQQIGYDETSSFSALVLDYIADAPGLRDFYAHEVSIDGVQAAITARKEYPTNRENLVAQLKEQYANRQVTNKLQANIDALLQENTFTITTAHQPNIFTGHLYFIYKILHAVKLADTLTTQLPGNTFVPVYYMGSEDADLEELGEVTINGKKYTWQTDQKGAVGRMLIDKAFMDIIKAINGQLSVEKHGAEIMALVQDSYALGKTIEQATFEFCHELFKGFGLVILLPDNAKLKEDFLPVAIKELDTQFSRKAVSSTLAAFPAEYKAQAAGRDINLFYLKDAGRDRIEAVNDGFAVTNTPITFTRDELEKELMKHPQRISPNVILRPVLQEMILPNVVFIGGGGELAYWLELKKVFEAVQVPYPVLVLRNSFTIINKKAAGQMEKLGLKANGLFASADKILNTIVKRDATLKLNFSEEKFTFLKLYKQLRSDATLADASLEQHVWALQSKAMQQIEKLEKKMLKATKRKFEAQDRQVIKLRANLFPGDGLQERVDNILPYYAVYGREFLHVLYEYSNSLEQRFCVLTEAEDNV